MIDRRLSLPLLTVLIVVLTSAVATGQGSKSAPISGKDLYNNYCAVCHGNDGSGNGPLADELKTAQ